MTERVLVLGGTGKTGALVVDGLRERGVAVRVATRHPQGDDQVRFDWDDPATFGPALDGVDAAYLVAPVDRTDHLTTMKPLLEQAVERGIGPLVLLSAASIDEAGPMMGEVHAWLHVHAPRWVVLRPSWFMQNFVMQFLPAIREDGCIYSATEGAPIAFIDAADIAAVAVEALTVPDFPSGDIVITGPAPVSYDEAAAEITRLSGRPVRHCRLTVDQLAERYQGFGLPEDYAHILAGMDAAIARGSENRTTGEVERITGRKPTSLQDFLTTHRAAFA